MEILYPLPALSGAGSASDSSVTVLANHTVAWERRGAFLDTLKPLLENFNAFPGALGCKVFEQHEDSLARITILQRFAAAADHEAWLRSADFRRWRDAVSLIQPTVEHVRTYSGIEALFAAGKSPGAPPRWKMAVVLCFAVFPLSLALSVWFGRALASISPLAGALITTPLMVVLMTYVMVPIFTGVFARWLQPSLRSR